MTFSRERTNVNTCTCTAPSQNVTVEENDSDAAEEDENEAQFKASKVPKQNVCVLTKKNVKSGIFWSMQCYIKCAKLYNSRARK